MAHIKVTATPMKTSSSRYTDVPQKIHFDLFKLDSEEEIEASQDITSAAWEYTFTTDIFGLRRVSAQWTGNKYGLSQAAFAEIDIKDPAETQLKQLCIAKRGAQFILTPGITYTASGLLGLAINIKFTYKLGEIPDQDQWIVNIGGLFGLLIGGEANGSQMTEFWEITTTPASSTYGNRTYDFNILSDVGDDITYNHPVIFRIGVLRRIHMIFGRTSDRRGLLCIEGGATISPTPPLS